MEGVGRGEGRGEGRKAWVVKKVWCGGCRWALIGGGKEGLRLQKDPPLSTPLLPPRCPLHPLPPLPHRPPTPT